MLGINLKHSLAIVAVSAGVLTAAVTDGTSNTIMFARASAVIESVGTKYTMAGKNEVAVETFSGDAYDNEMGVRDR